MRILATSLVALVVVVACGGSVEPEAPGPPVTCGTKTCASGEVCVVTTSSGGPCCHPPTTSYDCKPLPAKCGTKLACPCAETLCQCGGCKLGSAAGTLECACAYP